MAQHRGLPLGIVDVLPALLGVGELDGDLHPAEKHIPQGVVAAVDDLIQ